MGDTVETATAPATKTTATTTTTASPDTPSFGSPSVGSATVFTKVTLDPGWRSSEFWLSTAAKLLGLLFASGILGDGSPAERIAGIAAMVLTALGYTVARSLVKSSGTVLLVLLALTTQTGCEAARQRVLAGVGALIDCQADGIRTGVAELVPLATQALMASISNDGRHVDTSAIKVAALALKADVGRCALATAFALLATPPAKIKDAPQATGLEIDGVALRAAFNSIRPELGGAVFATSAGVM